VATGRNHFTVFKLKVIWFCLMLIPNIGTILLPDVQQLLMLSVEIRVYLKYSIFLKDLLK